jgi:branched-chain amino acid transport system substrate-binding protein
MIMSRTRNTILGATVSRRAALHSAAGILGGAMLPGGLILPARAADNAPLGTYPEGSSGPSVFVGISVPRTGTYAAAGEDLIKGYQLAIEHLNEGNALMQKISPNIKKGVLGKEVKFGIADSEAKPNTAVQNLGKFISDNKAVMVTGSVSSAEAVADNKFADREKAFTCLAFRVRTTQLERTASAIPSVNASTARPLQKRSLLNSSRPSARTRRSPI